MEHGRLAQRSVEAVTGSARHLSDRLGGGRNDEERHPDPNGNNFGNQRDKIVHNQIAGSEPTPHRPEPLKMTSPYPRCVTAPKRIAIS